MHSKLAKQLEVGFTNYEFIEQRLIVLNNPYTGGNIYQAFTRCYFAANTKLLGKRIVGISIGTKEAGYNLDSNLRVVPTSDLPNMLLTMLDYSEKEKIKDFPLTELHQDFNFGKTRVFNFLADIEKSYLVSVINFNLVGVRSWCVPIIFYTTNRDF